MSLIRPVLRMTVKRALLNKTWAQDRVMDSNNTPLADQLDTDAAPCIGIYTDEDSAIDVEGRDIFRTPRNLTLSIEIGCAKQVIVEGSSPQVEVPETDEGLEFICDAVQSQVLDALWDPTNEWAELFRDTAFSINRMVSQRGGSAERDTRWAARQIQFVCDVVADCPPGVVPAGTHPIARFIEMAHADEVMRAAGELVEQVAHKTTASDWRQAQAWLGLTRKGIKSIGLAPVDDTQEDNVELEQVTVNDLVPEAPTISIGSPVANPPAFYCDLDQSDTERGARPDDIVEVAVLGADQSKTFYVSSRLTAQDIAVGLIMVQADPLPGGQNYQARARMRRRGLADVALYSKWSEAVLFFLPDA